MFTNFFFFNPFPNNKFYTLPYSKCLQTTILNLMKMAESSSDGWKTLWEKEKLLVTSNFSFSHSVFKACFLEASKGVIVWEWVNPFPNKSWFFTSLQYKSFENFVGKGEIAHNEQFYLFPQCCLPV